MIGKTIRQYEILSELGSGGMGTVYLAHDTLVGRRVAIKFLSAPHAATADYQKRFLLEAQAAGRLRHPGIVALYAIEDFEGQPFLVQEYVNGENLRGRLARVSKLDRVSVVHLAFQLTSALGHAHRHGVIHRDLKPENVFFWYNPSAYLAKIGDFGISSIQGEEPLTKDNSLLGTLPYIAPERLEGNRGDGRVDLFSLGAILHEVVTGQRAFPGSSEAEILYALVNKDPATVKERDPVLRDIGRIASRLLSKDPSARPPSAEATEGLLWDVAKRYKLERCARPYGLKLFEIPSDQLPPEGL